MLLLCCPPQYNRHFSNYERTAILFTEPPANSNSVPSHFRRQYSSRGWVAVLAMAIPKAPPPALRWCRSTKHCEIVKSCGSFSEPGTATRFGSWYGMRWLASSNKPFDRNRITNPCSTNNKRLNRLHWFRLLELTEGKRGRRVAFGGPFHLHCNTISSRSSFQQWIMLLFVNVHSSCSVLCVWGNELKYPSVWWGRIRDGGYFA